MRVGFVDPDLNDGLEVKEILLFLLQSLFL
jgi:hypothetical protein